MPATIRGRGPLKYVQVSLHSRGGAPEDLSFTTPSGAIVNAKTNGFHTLPGGAFLQATVQTTARGTVFHDVILYSPDATMPFEVGAWTARSERPESVRRGTGAFVDG